jgi:hypothetical protein
MSTVKYIEATIGKDNHITNRLPFQYLLLRLQFSPDSHPSFLMDTPCIHGVYRKIYLNISSQLFDP